MEKLIWPGVVVIILILFFLIFHKAISELIGRISKTTRETETIKRIKNVVNTGVPKSYDEQEFQSIEKNEEEGVSEYFKFSKDMERSIITKNDAYNRKIKFRIGHKENCDGIYDVKLNAYLVITKLIHNQNNSGYGNNWKDIQIRDYLPSLKGYWGLSHMIDDIENPSPFLKLNEEDNIQDINIHIYASGYLKTGEKIYGHTKYNWNRENCKFGKFKLRGLGQEKLSQKDFHRIVEIEEDKPAIWDRINLK